VVLVLHVQRDAAQNTVLLLVLLLLVVERLLLLLLLLQVAATCLLWLRPWLPHRPHSTLWLLLLLLLLPQINHATSWHPTQAHLPSSHATRRYACWWAATPLVAAAAHPTPCTTPSTTSTTCRPC
jgi:hypothetical protein